MNVTGLSENQLFLNPNFNPGVEQQKEIDDKIARLEEGEPIEYIINNAEFYGLDFYVNPGVLIPRNETELIVDQALSEISAITQFNPGVELGLIDVGTGSSCIPISILSKLPSFNPGVETSTYVIDISKKALKVSKINIEKHNFQNKIKQIHSNLLDEILNDKKYLELLNTKKLIITANLPYIRNYEVENIDEATKKYEPDLALYGGMKTGFELYEKLIDQCFELKNQGYEITLFAEIGFDQYFHSMGYLIRRGLEYKYFKDNGYIWRCIRIKFGKN